MTSEFDLTSAFSQFVPKREGHSVIMDRTGAPQFWEFNGQRLPIAAMGNPMIGLADRAPMGLPISFVINHNKPASSTTMGSWLSDATGINIDVIAAVGHFFNEVGKVFAALWDAIIHIDWGKLLKDIIKVVQIVALIIAVITPIGIAVAGVSLSAMTGSLMVDIGSFLGDITSIITDVLSFPLRAISGGAIDTTEIMGDFFFGPKVAANSLGGGSLAGAFNSAGSDLLSKSTTDILLDYGRSQAITAASGAMPGGGIAAGFLMDNSGNIVSSISNADISKINLPSIDFNSIDLTSIPGAIANAISNISIGTPDFSNISMPELAIGAISIPEINIGQIPDISFPGGGKKKVASKRKKKVGNKNYNVYTFEDGTEYEVAEQETNLMPFFLAAGVVMMITGRG